MAFRLILCDVRNCGRQAIVEDDDERLCQRHMPDPHTRSWAEMKAEGIEVETMPEYQNEVRGFNDMDPPDPPDPYDRDIERGY